MKKSKKVEIESESEPRELEVLRLRHVFQSIESPQTGRLSIEGRCRPLAVQNGRSGLGDRDGE